MEQHKIVALFDEQECEQVLHTLNNRMRSDPYLCNPFAEVKISIYTEDLVSIPNVIYKTEATALSHTFFEQSDSGKLYHQPRPELGFTTVFGLPEGMVSFLNHNFSTHKKFDHQAALLSLASQLPPSALLLDFSAGAIAMLCLQNNEVIFQRSYGIASADELSYYLLLIINLLALDVQSLPVYLCGIIHKDDEKYQALSRYFNTVYFLLVNDENLNSEILENMPAHYYTTLLAVHKCG
ncbi:hypothetical protein D9M68_547780 [compost metagenome]